jgi:hypothetical protein
MDKKGIFHLVLNLLRGSLSMGLVVAALEFVVKGPRQRMKSKGLLGIAAAMALSFLLPFVAKMIYRAVARPHRA